MIKLIALNLDNRDIGGMNAGDLPFSSGERREVIVRPQSHAFLPRRITINGRPSLWIVHNIRVGGKSQFSAGDHDVPGEIFAFNDGTEVSMDPVQVGQDFALEVSYVGQASGIRFSATVGGLAANASA